MAGSRIQELKKASAKRQPSCDTRSTMTRAQIEKELLEMPEGERAAVVAKVVSTLSEGHHALIRRQMANLGSEEPDALGDRLEAQMLSWFEGSRTELTDEVWDEIRNADPKDLDPDSWAIPPGWKPRSPHD